MYVQRLCLTLVVSCTPLIAIDALAGSATMTSKEGGSTVFEYREQLLRVNIPDQENSYIVFRDNTIYTVMQQEDHTIVMDAGSAMKSMGFNASSAVPSDINAEVVSLEKTGRTENVAGIKGDVYELNFVDEDGQNRTEELVLSDDARALEFRDALFQMLEIAATLTSGATPENAQSMRDQLEGLDAGMLRFGSEFTLTKIDDEPVDAKRFELPAAPMNLEGIGAMLGGFSQQAPVDVEEGEGSAKKPGLFGSVMGAIGSKVNRQVDRIGDSADQEVDEETDEQVDGALDKAFGKLFGR
ncbi:MAG: hypothetical protein ACI8RN_003123 [Glaciecola sp.]|jgi:hypothetical protein|uniref:hypothetical protein n=1 Tax=Congregibacter sp. TaxID=2744308 RepID=UPI0039E223D0